SWSPLLTVGQTCRNEKLILGADLHQLKSLGPAFDDTADRKRRRLTALVGTVEFRPIHQRAAIIYRHGVATFWLCAAAFFQDFVLQTALGRFHAFLGFVCGEEFFRLSAVLLSRVR